MLKFERDSFIKDNLDLHSPDLFNWDTNEEKADHFPHWKANGTHYHARRVKGSRVKYEIIED